MTSRFFAADSSSESESSGEEELYSDNENQSEQEEDSDEDESEDGSGSDSDSDDGKQGASKFLKGDDSDSDESDDDTPKVVKSAKSKRLEELDGVIKVIENAKRIGDWSVISNEFDKLNRQVTKVTAGQKVPKQYIKEIADLEDYMNETIAKQKVTPKKMNATNAKGLNAMKQKVKKNNKEFADEIEKYRKDQDTYMESDDEDDQPAAPVPQSRSATYVTRTAADDDEDEGGFATVGRGGRTLQYTPESILAHLRTVNESRGRKNTDRNEQIRIMERLFTVAVNPYQKIRVLLSLISTRFDLVSNSSSGYMAQDSWKLAAEEIGKLLEVLEENREIIVTEAAEAWEDDDKMPVITPGETFRIPGSIVSTTERLDDELTRSLQHIDPHTAEYIERLQDEQTLYNLILRGQVYIESAMKVTNADLPQENLNRLIMRRIEHVYFKPSQVIDILEKNGWESLPAKVDSTVTPRGKELSAGNLVSVLCTYLFEKSEAIIRGRAFLAQVYYTALHDQYYRARDMLLMSHLQETIPNFDVSTQILFNRTLVQVGLCAFRAGLVYDAQTTLQDICGSGRQKELLAQGVVIQRYVNVSPEQERLERQRQLPFHMHINLELLECIYLTCSMLLEIPLMAQIGSSPDIRKRIISKTFRRHFDFHERQIFTGPPENTRDHIMQASKNLAMGEWKRSVELINGIKIWDLVAESEKIKTMLSEQIQEEGLRTYLFTYASYYDTVAVKTLASMFELPERKVAAVISKMISHDEIAAALDQVNSVIIFRKGVELSRLQSLALTLSDKASGLIESNERTLETRTSGMENRFERQGGRGRGGGRGGRGGGNRGGPRTRGGQRFEGGALGSAIKA